MFVMLNPEKTLKESFFFNFTHIRSLARFPYCSITSHESFCTMQSIISLLIIFSTNEHFLSI